MAYVESKNRATSDPAKRKEVLAEIEARGIDDVLLWFTDLEGHLKSFSISISEAEGALDDGMGFDGSSITGFNAIEESDMVAIPDPETFQVLPDGKTGRMICDVVTPDGEAYAGDPRYVLRRALERMEAMGFDTFNVGPEAEYFLFKDDKGTETLDEGGYFAQTTMDAASGVRRDTIRALESMGIPVEYHHHEVGPSQHEIDIRYTNALDMADYMLTYRLVVKEVAKQHGYHATFMPKPLFGRTARGCTCTCRSSPSGQQHVLRRDDKWHLSDTAKAFIAGQLPPRARDVGRVRAVGQLVQAARAGLRGAESTSRGRSGTAPLWCGSRCTSRAPSRRRAPRSAVPIRPATRTSPSRRSLHAGLEGIEQGYELPDPMETNLRSLRPSSGVSVASLPRRSARRYRRAVSWS